MPRKSREASTWKDAVLSRDEQFAAKRSVLIREAARAFGQKGYHNASLDDVAQQLGVTKPALYYYVKSKQEILFECHMISSDVADRAVAYADELEGTGLDRVVALCRRYLESLISEFGSFAVLSELDALTAQNKRVVAGRRAKFDRAFRDLVSAGVKDGSIRPVDPKLTVFFFMGSVNWMTRWFDPAGPMDGPEIVEHFSQYLRHAIRAE